MSRHIERALQYHKAGFYKLAIDAYDKALDELPDNPALLANRAEEYVLMGRFGDAIRDFKHVLESGFTNEAVWVNYGLALQCTGNYEAALVAFDIHWHTSRAIRDIAEPMIARMTGDQARLKAHWPTEPIEFPVKR